MTMTKSAAALSKQNISINTCSIAARLELLCCHPCRGSIDPPRAMSPFVFFVITVLLLTFFSIKLLFLGRTHDLWYLSSQADFCPAAAATRSRLYKQSGDAKRMVRNHCELTILQFFHSPFFQLNCYSWGERVICDISAHRLIFAPPPLPPDRVYINRAATRKEWWETIDFSWFYSSFTHLFFN